jgi:hypothetical protein
MRGSLYPSVCPKFMDIVTSSFSSTSVLNFRPRTLHSSRSPTLRIRYSHCAAPFCHSSHVSQSRVPHLIFEGYPSDMVFSYSISIVFSDVCRNYSEHGVGPCRSEPWHSRFWKWCVAFRCRLHDVNLAALSVHLEASRLLYLFIVLHLHDAPSLRMRRQERR